MLELDFLSADTPIIKSYELNNDKELIKHNYPFVYEFTSHSYQCASLKQAHAKILVHAKKGDCLLKGRLQRELRRESRAGSTNREIETNWVCLDLDGIESYASVDEFLRDIGCDDVDYILQWSSSMGIENSTGLRCHIFMQLGKPIHPQLLKHWLKFLNLTKPNLASQLELTATGNALRWPLDITTCQNDKLLYIAPPDIGVGITDPYPVVSKRISFHTRMKRGLKIAEKIPNKDAIRQLEELKLTELRIAANLPKRRTTKFKFSGSVEYMLNPDTATVTGMKEERGFMYFNLNNGDSWAYYHPLDNPKFIHNFKGEPSYRTEDLLPEYWAEIQKKAHNYQPNTQGLTYFAFRDFQTSNYYNGTYDSNTRQLNLAMAKSESQLRQFMKQHNQVVGETIPDWNLIWDPHSMDVVNADQRTLNTYQPSEFYLNYDPTKTSASKANQVPPTIARVIHHVLGGHTPTINYFLNWLACIVQYRQATGTAWVLHGTEGTGKGVLYHKILVPMFGRTNVVSKRMEEIESEFTGFMENVFLVFIDEIESGQSLFHDKISAKLRNLITEPTISIRAMYRPAHEATNYSNLIFSSNKPSPVLIPRDDRRYNVGIFQGNKLQITALEIDETIPQELEQFFQYLMRYPADRRKARVPIVNDAKLQLVHISMTALDAACEALLSGDLAFFWDHLPNNANKLSPLEAAKYQAFREVLVPIINDPHQNEKVARDDIACLLDYCVGNIPKSPHKFSSLLKHHRIHLEQIWVNNRNMKGLTVKWTYNTKWLTTCQQEIRNGLI